MVEAKGYYKRVVLIFKYMIASYFLILNNTVLVQPLFLFARLNSPLNFVSDFSLVPSIYMDN